MDTELPIIYLARHGETAWSLTGQHTGLTGLPLTERGERNARALGQRLDGLVFRMVFTSPLRRARRACELAGFGSGGVTYYTRIDSPATPEQKTRLRKLSPEGIHESSLAGEQIIAKLTRAPGNNAPIGGLKIVAASGWFAARPSGTEDIYKVYAESFQDQSHLNAILTEAETIVNNALNSSKEQA